MLTMEPPPLSRIAGAQCFMPSIGPVRLTASVRFHASTVVSAIPWRAIVPALLTRTWSLPKRPNAAATTSFQELSSATSWRRNRTLPPSPARRWARLSPAAASMSVKTTAASSRTKSSASAVPWPPAAPVISATVPGSRAISSPPLALCHEVSSSLRYSPITRFSRTGRVAPRNDGGCHCERWDAISQRRHFGFTGEITSMATPLPYTGKEFLNSLDDGREVWIYGERIKNIAEHPAFRNTARMVARLYDALHRDHAENKNRLTCPTEWGGFTHPYFIAPRSAEDLVAGRDGIAEWARLTWGWLGRSPDYKAALLACLGGNTEFFNPYQENARRWYRYSQERVPFVGHALLHPPVDRNLVPGAAGGLADVCAHVTRETDAGICVTGAKVVATGSALTHFTFVAHVGLLPIQDPKFALVFLVPTNAKGVKFICRVSNKQRAAVLGSPFDY